MDDLAHSLKNFGKRGRTAARVEALRNQVAELEGKLAASDALVLQLKRASHKATGELERGERAVTDLKGELTKKNTRINRLQELYDGVCLQLSERGAQVGDLRVCVTELKAQVATLSERERASTDELEGVRQEAFQRNQQLEERLAMVTHRTMSLQDEIRRIEGESRAESSKTQRAEEQLVSANQQICELRTRIRALEQETLAKDTRVEQMRDRLGFAAQISYRLTAKLQQSNRARDQSVAITQELEDKIQGQDVIIRDLREKNQQKDRVIKQLEAKLQKQQGEDDRALEELFVYSKDSSLTFRNIAGETTIIDFKKRIQQEMLISTQDQELLFVGEILENRRSLKSYSIRSGDILHLGIVRKDTQPSSVRTIKTLFFRGMDGRTTTLRNIPLDTKIATLRENLCRKASICDDSLRLVCGTKVFQADGSLGDYGISNDSTIDIITRLKGGKPVITLYPRYRQHTTVSIGLCDGFDFTYLHLTDVPLSRIKTLRVAAWEAWVDPNGTITTDKGNQVSYLFWEGLYDQCGSIDTSFGLHQPQRTFMVPIDDLPSFMDEFMERCGFLIKERQDMITYWAPQLLQHAYIAIRFLSPPEYHDAAPLAIHPIPDRLVRLFALFKGIEASAARERRGFAEADVDSQVGVVLQGMAKPVVGAGDFCAFEWGGMIVR